MLKRHSKLDLPIAAILLLASMAYGARSLVRLTTDVVGIGPIPNGMTGAASIAQNLAFAGPVSGAAADPTFRSYGIASIGALGDLTSDAWAVCTPTGTAVTCAGDVADSTGSDTTATSTLPTYTTASSDTTGAGCGTQPNGVQTFWFGSVRNQRVYARVRFSSTTGIRARFALINGSELFCGSETSIANAIVAIRFSSTTPDTNFIGEATDAVGTNVTSCDTGVAGDTNFHLMSIEYDSALGRVNYYVDDMTTPGCFQSSNIPTGLVMGVMFGAYCNTCGGVQKFTDFASYEIRQPPY